MAMSLATDAQDYTQKYNRLMEPALPEQGYKGQLRQYPVLKKLQFPYEPGGHQGCLWKRHRIQEME